MKAAVSKEKDFGPFPLKLHTMADNEFFFKLHKIFRR